MNKHDKMELGPHFETFIEDKLKDGRFASASEVVKAALRLLEEQEVHIEALRVAIIEGETSGPAQPFDLNTFLARKHIGQL
jgi:antitoxin ParD1/3/4